MSGKNQIMGRATITVDGKKLNTENGATLNLGGSNRSPKMGGGVVHGYMEEDVPPSMECNVIKRKDVSARELSDIVDATVLFDGDDGSQYILRDAFTTEPVTINSGDGTVPLKMSAISVDEV